MNTLVTLAVLAVALVTAFLVYDNRRHRRRQMEELKDAIAQTSSELACAIRDNPADLDYHIALRNRLCRLRKQLDSL